MNKKKTSLILIIILVIVIAIILYFIFANKKTTPIVSDAEAACVNTGGTVSAVPCCSSSNEFPNTCMIGACRCSADNSKETKTCVCPEGSCFDGTGCATTEVPTSE
jgi:uncharacterized protein (UPF0333 family)